jgi:glycerate kinase
MRIVIAPDSFKGTYTAEQVATAIATGVKDADGEPVCVAGADGGEGTLAALTERRPADMRRAGAGLVVALRTTATTA